MQDKSSEEMEELVKDFLEYFAVISKDERETIATIVSWDDETRAAFKLANQTFESQQRRKGYDEVYVRK